MAAAPLVLCAVLLPLAWRTGERAWRTGLAAMGVACPAFGAFVVATVPEASATNQEPGSPTRWIHLP